MTDKQEIENLLIEYLNEYESLSALREQYNDNLRNGYFLITKSRYSMGQKSLGQLQYPESMKSTFNLSMPTNELKYEEKDDSFISIHYKNINNSNNNSNNSNYKNSNSNKINDNSTYNKNNNSSASTSTSTTRRRNIPSNPTITTSKEGVTTMGSLESLLKNSNINQENGSSDDDSDNSDESDYSDSDSDNDNSGAENDQDKKKDRILKKKLKENKKIIKKDPLYWFGIMTPQSLKQSQNHFKQAISQSIEISNKLIKMELIYKKYIELLEK